MGLIGYRLPRTLAPVAPADGTHQSRLTPAGGTATHNGPAILARAVGRCRSRPEGKGSSGACPAAGRAGWPPRG
ncbi:hypothetical protein [Streptomyces yangpuensis]|uniref:hypothetical protein n=1 Tax=Streptomyces yangpuensis TaxID=1648182 RepID=UPI0038217E6B